MRLRLKVLYIVFNKENRMKWISVKDRLPENNVEVLTYGKSDIEIENFLNSVFYFHDDGCDFPDMTITHWMPLPKPPER